ncbi:uncharacterized protein Bfra_004233 [Botrytis fragariae]|uniref:Uncharacterized protein n=1 Tax=Botrytis fragariae TaxID=1964551 RepID=A0A8H6AV89_9HELO|nr:uncharacterized protein Bfra_004233 [Botrytis fragariae]KAF5874227.1 hypothetical protein Bfra_004233 [Botrytis fragariae]
MKPSKRLRLLLSQMPIEAFGDSGHEIQAFQSSFQGTAIEIENVDNTLDDRDFEFRQRFVTSTGATSNHESTKQVATSIVTKKKHIRGDSIADVIQEVAIEVLHEDLVQKGTTDEEVAKETDFEDVVSDEATEQNILGESFSERDSVQMDLLSLTINMEDDAEKNNIEKGVIAGNAIRITMENSSNSDPNHAFENSGAYFHIILKIDGGALGEEIVKDESEDGDDGRVLA